MIQSLWDCFLASPLKIQTFASACFRSAIWLRQITDETGFEIIYVAVLRSIGVPARLDSNNHAEFWDGNKW